MSASSALSSIQSDKVLTSTPGVIHVSYALFSSLPSSPQHTQMSQEPLRRVSRLKKVKDMEDGKPIRQASRLLGAQRGTAPSGRNTSGGAARTRMGGATSEPATSGERRGLSQSLSKSLPPTPPVPSLSQPVLDLPDPDDDLMPVPRAASVNDVPQGPAPLSDAQEESLSDYWYALTHVGGVFRLEKRHFVFQEWDNKSESLKVCRSSVHSASPLMS